MKGVECLADDFLNIEPNVGGDLIVPRPRRVQLARHVSHRLEQPPLDVHVNVFELVAPWEGVRLDLLTYPFKSGNERRGLVF